MAGTTAGALVTTTAGPIVSGPTASMSSLTGLITVRLTRVNFLLWKAQVIPNLTGAGLFGYLNGSVPAPPKTIVMGTGDAAHSAPNPEYKPGGGPTRPCSARSCPP